MTKPPGRKIEPLPPRPGAFDTVLKSARARRRRQAALVTASVAVLALVSGVSFALGSSMSVTQRISAVANNFTDRGTATATPTPSNQASPRRKAAKRQHTRPPRQTSRPPSSHTVAGGGSPVVKTPRPDSYLRGRVLDERGRPVENLLVQPGAPDHAVFASTGLVAAVTDAAGEFVIACPKAPVLVSGWRLGHPVPTEAVGGRWAATYVGGSQTQAVVPACGRARTTTIVKAGATLTGTVRIAGSCPDATVPLWLWLDGDRHNTVRIRGLRDGDTFRYSGLPAGTHVMGASGIRTPVVVAPGGEVAQDVAYTCPAGSEPSTSSSPEPTESSPSTSTSPSETPTGTGSGSPTTSPPTTEPTASALSRAR